MRQLQEESASCHPQHYYAASIAFAAGEAPEVKIKAPT